MRSGGGARCASSCATRSGAAASSRSLPRACLDSGIPGRRDRRRRSSGRAGGDRPYAVLGRAVQLGKTCASRGPRSGDGVVLGDDVQLLPACRVLTLARRWEVVYPARRCPAARKARLRPGRTGRCRARMPQVVVASSGRREIGPHDDRPAAAWTTRWWACTKIDNLVQIGKLSESARAPHRGHRRGSR